MKLNGRTLKISTSSLRLWSFFLLSLFHSISWWIFVFSLLWPHSSGGVEAKVISFAQGNSTDLCISALTFTLALLGSLHTLYRVLLKRAIKIRAARNTVKLTPYDQRKNMYINIYTVVCIKNIDHNVHIEILIISLLNIYSFI